MDPVTILGILIAFGAILSMILLEGGNVGSILLPAPMILVFGATIAVGVASGTAKDLVLAAKGIPRAFRGKVESAPKLIEQLSAVAEKARREGLLALESEMETITDPFMKKGLQMAVDGTDPDDLFEILAAEVKSKKAAVTQGASFWNDAGGYSPTIGIIGTVIGLIHVLENLSQPDKLGHLIAGAFVATLWGVLSANVMFLPWGKRIKLVGMAEAARMELIIDGVLAIQAGANPRVVATKLKSKMVHTGPAAPAEAAA